jgi:Leucine-rich repeat (LRR) protein
LKSLLVSKSLNSEVSAASAQALPEAVGDLTSLQTLNISVCSRLRELPARVGDLVALQNLELSNLNELAQAPETVKTLNALKRLLLRFVASSRRCHRRWGGQGR